jgi:methionyl-tRNA formyltransferase
MGSPDFALPSLRRLAQDYPLAGVVTQPDRAAGRGRGLKSPPVKTLAQELGIPVIQPEKLHQPEAVEQLRAWAPDLIVVAAFGQILKPELLHLPQFGALNVHASLLPRWRGAAPIQAAISSGDEETGVTIMKMDPGLDSGPILSQRALRLTRDDTAGSVAEALSQLGADLLAETIPGYLSGQIKPIPQPTDGVTLAPTLKKEQGRLDFTRPADELARRVRAFDPWPGTFMDFQDAALKVLRAHPAAGNAPAGKRMIFEDKPAVGSGDGLLVLDIVQMAGRKPVDGKSFLAGARDWEN